MLNVKYISSTFPAKAQVYEASWIVLVHAVILLPVHPASFAHNFVSGMQKFLFHRAPENIRAADLSLKIVFWTHKFAVGLIDMEKSKSQDP